jgi:hypothetical protein
MELIKRLEQPSASQEGLDSTKLVSFLLISFLAAPNSINLKVSSHSPLVTMVAVLYENNSFNAQHMALVVQYFIQGKVHYFIFLKNKISLPASTQF